MENNSRLTDALLGVIAVIAVGSLLKVAQPIILPLIIAWLLSYILGPVVDFLRRFKLPTPIAVALVLVLLVGACVLGASFLNARVSSFVTAFPRYQERLMDLFNKVTQSSRLPSDFLSEIDWGERVGGYVMSLSGWLVNFMSKLTMVIIFLIFLLLGRPYFAYKLKKAFSEGNSERILGVQKSISAQIGRYLAVQFVISLATGFCVWLALVIIGVDFAVTWGALAFLLNFIPTIGSIVATIPPILVASVQFPTFLPALTTLVTLLAIQMVIGNGIAPKVMGDRLHLSPVVVLVSLVFWGWLWGFIGALLSVPIASAIKIICENIEPLRPISVMMGSGKIYEKEFTESKPVSS